MARHSPKPPAARLNGWGATGRLDGSSRRFLTAAQMRGMRLQLSDLDAKVRQLSCSRVRAAALVRGCPRWWKPSSFYSCWRSLGACRPGRPQSRTKVVPNLFEKISARRQPRFSTRSDSDLTPPYTRTATVVAPYRRLIVSPLLRLRKLPQAQIGRDQRGCRNASRATSSG